MTHCARGGCGNRVSNPDLARAAWGEEFCSLRCRTREHRDRRTKILQSASGTCPTCGSDSSGPDTSQVAKRQLKEAGETIEKLHRDNRQLRAQIRTRGDS